MKYYYNDFQIDINKLHPNEICMAVDLICCYEEMNIHVDHRSKHEFVWWSPLNTYVGYFDDGGHTGYYFCKDYINIKGHWGTKEDVYKCFEYLKSVANFT